jgi:GTPase SAR1 family protein
MDYAKILSVINTAISSSFLSEEKQGILSKQLNKIKKRISDNKIYLGIVGEFSTGKSTLINSLIGEDFLVMNALQGTTTTITKLEYGRKIGLKIELSSGKVLKYDRDKTEILKLYKPDIYEHMSIFEKMKIQALDMLHSNNSDKYLLEIFDNITTSDEISKTLNEVTVYYPSELLNNGIVIVDTPGTDSLTPSHAEITRRAIKEICDIALVIIPATQPLSQSLIDYIDDNLGDVADKCIYFITKIELIRRSIERTHMQKGVVQRIMTYLNVENPHVFFAPSLLSLEEKCVIEKTGRTEHLSEDERHELCSQFESDINSILAKIHKERELAINDKIQRLTSSLRDELQTEISARNIELKEELDDTQMRRVKPLKEFMTEFYSTHGVYSYSYIESVICNAISSNQNQFKRYVFEEIDGCSTKDDTQATMERNSVVSKGETSFNNCYKSFTDILSKTHSSYTENFNEFKALFTQVFSIDAIDFNYTILNKLDWQRKYKFNYNKSGLTTFKPFRMFKSLSSVKEEMKKDVGPKIEKEFAKMEKDYIFHLKKSYADIARQMERMKQIYIDKYEIIIAKRIKESNETEILLSTQLKQLEKNLEQLDALEL